MLYIARDLYLTIHIYTCMYTYVHVYIHTFLLGNTRKRWLFGWLCMANFVVRWLLLHIHTHKQCQTTENEFYINVCVDMCAYMYNRVTGLSSRRIPICVYIIWFCIYYKNTQLHTCIINLRIQDCYFRIAQRKSTCIHVHVCVCTNTYVHM